MPSGGGVNGFARATVAQDVDLPPDAPVVAPGRLCVRLDVGGVRPRTGIAHRGQLLARLHGVTERRLPRRVGRPPTRRLEVSGVHGAGAPREVRRQFGATLRAERQLSHEDQNPSALDSSGSIWTIHT